MVPTWIQQVAGVGATRNERRSPQQSTSRGPTSPARRRCHFRVFCLCLSLAARAPLSVVAVVAPAAAIIAPVQAADDDLQAKLATLPQPWREPVHRLSAAEYEETLRYWAEKFPHRLTLEQVGASAIDLPIFLLTITDQSVAEADKQICLITSLHGGPERSGSTTILHLVEWLLSDAADAAVVRRKQMVLLMPINNPKAFFVTDRFGNDHHIDPYTGGGPQNWDFDTMTFKAIDKAAEIKAFLSVVDRYQPEVHADVHGIGLQEYPPEQLGERTLYRGQTMFEVTGSAYSNFAVRPWDWRVTEAMVSAGLAAGYPSDRFEADAQRGFWGPALQPLADRLWLGRASFYTAQYGYAKYHTMLTTLEVGWEESGVARLKGLLDVGNHVWSGSLHAGYPVDRVKAFVGHFVTAAGRSAAERRRSRVELWQCQAGFSQAMLYPQTAGRDSYVVALSAEAAGLLDADKARLLANLHTLPGMQSDAIEAFIRAGPEIKLYVDRSRPMTAASKGPLQHGLGLRLRLPYRKLELVDLRLNGHLLRESPTDGYQTWQANGFTQVQVTVPPAAAKATDLFVITCAYLPDVERSYGWSPPAAVTDRLRQRTP